MNYFIVSDIPIFIPMGVWGAVNGARAPSLGEVYGVMSPVFKNRYIGKIFGKILTIHNNEQCS